MTSQNYRLVTRSDFDGLVCGMLLREAGLIEEIKFVHPKDMQDGTVSITERDIITNLPYVTGCHLAFDHHASEIQRNPMTLGSNHIIDADADSAARVVYRHLGGETTFPGVSAELMEAVDKADSARFSRAEILSPDAWVLLNFLMDPRTGLGRFRSFRISNYDLMMQLIDRCRYMSIGEVLDLPDVRERVELYKAHAELFQEQLRRCATVQGKLVILDLRDQEMIYAGNRFMIYALFPECQVSMHVMWGLKQQNTVFALGKSILNRGSTANIGAICLSYGGGGHEAAGTCQIENGRSEVVREKLIRDLNA